MTSIVRGAAAVLIISATAACPQKPELMRRYDVVDGSTYQAADTDMSVSVGVFSLEKPSGSPKGLLDLSDKGQAEYVGAVAAKTTSTGQLRAGLAKKFAGGSGLNNDFTKVSRRIVFSAIDSGFGPADRLEEIRIELKLLNDTAPDGSACDKKTKKGCSNVQFVSWDRFSTNYGDVDLGQVSLTQSAGVEAEIGVTAPGINEITGATITPSISRDLKEELKVRQRYVALTGQLEPYKIILLQEGISGIDLIGTSHVDVDIDLGAGFLIPVYQFSGSGDAAGLESGSHMVPVANCDVRVIIGGTYRIRKVVKGGDTVIEGDDRVRFISKTILPKDQHILVRGRGLAGIRFELKPRENTVLQVLRPGVKDDPANYEPLYFTSAENAGELRAWLREASKTVTQLRLPSGHVFKLRNLDSLKATGLTQDEANGLRVVGDRIPECMPAS